MKKLDFINLTNKENLNWDIKNKLDFVGYKGFVNVGHIKDMEVFKCNAKVNSDKICLDNKHVAKNNAKILAKVNTILFSPYYAEYTMFSRSLCITKDNFNINNKFIYSGGFRQIEIISNEILPEYLHAFFSTDVFTTYKNNFAVGKNLRRLSPEFYKYIYLPKPSLKNQKQIVELMKLIKRIKKVKLKIKDKTELKKLLTKIEEQCKSQINCIFNYMFIIGKEQKLY